MGGVTALPLTDFETVLTTTRSVRRRLDYERPVERAVLEECLALAPQLALRSRGLGSVITTLHLHHEEEVAELLGIPPGVTQCCLLPVAHTVGLEFRPAPRRALSEVVFWDGWDA